MAQSNNRSADQIKQIMKEMRDELHAASEVVSASAELITNSLNSTPTPTSATTTSSPTNSHSSNIDQQSIETALQEIKSLISKGPVSSLSYSYKDALINSSTPRQLATATNQPPPVKQARAKAAVKERQLLIDLANEHPIRHQIYSHDEMISLFQTALDEIKENGPDLKIKSLFQLKNGGILLELSSKEAVEWAKQPEHQQRFINATGGKLNIKNRLYNPVVHSYRFGQPFQGRQRDATIHQGRQQNPRKHDCFSKMDQTYSQAETFPAIRACDVLTHVPISS